MKNVALVTTYPGRIEDINDTLCSLFNQIKPFDEVVLILYEDEFPNKELPNNIKYFLEKIINFKVRWLKYSDTYNRNMRAFKKYYVAINDYLNTETLIYQCDDDFIYHPLYTSIFNSICERLPKAFYNCFMYMGPDKKLLISGARTVYDARILKSDLLDDTYTLEKLYWKWDDDYFQYWLNQNQIKMYSLNILDYLTYPKEVISTFENEETKKIYSQFKNPNNLFFDDEEWRTKNFPNFKECNVEYINLEMFRG